MKGFIYMVVLFILIFQMLYNFVVAGTAKHENEGFLYNGVFSGICFLGVLVIYFLG